MNRGSREQDIHIAQSMPTLASLETAAHRLILIDPDFFITAIAWI